MNEPRNSDGIDQRLRHDLQVVAATVTGTAPAARADEPRKPRRRRLLLLGAGAVVVVPLVAAAAIVRDGPEYVDTIPPSSIVMEGSVDGSRYLLVESRRTGECGRPVTGVELVEERENLLGSEWNTTGYEYGEMVETDCGYVNDTSRYLEDPALFVDSGTEVGDSFVWVYAVHPDVTGVRITSGDYTETLTVYEVDGAGYAPFEVPAGMDEYTSELLIDDQVVPGSEEVQRLPRP